MHLFELSLLVNDKKKKISEQLKVHAENHFAETSAVYNGIMIKSDIGFYAFNIQTPGPERLISFCNPR